MSENIRDKADETINASAITYNLWELHSKLEGLYTLLESFNRDSVRNGYNTPDDKDEQIRLYTSVYPLVIDTLSNTITSIEQAAQDVDRFSLNILRQIGGAANQEGRC